MRVSFSLSLVHFVVRDPLIGREQAVADAVEGLYGFRNGREAVFLDFEMKDRVVVVVLFGLDHAQPLPRVVADRVGIAQFALA